MSLRIRFRFDGRCSVHPRYDPEKDGRPQHKDCSGCESLWVIYLYTGIARRKSERGDGMFVSRPQSQSAASDRTSVLAEDAGAPPEDQDNRSTELDAPPD